MVSLAKTNTTKEYPFKQWREELLLKIDEAIKYAWYLLVDEEKRILNKGKEEEITNKLQHKLQKIMDDEDVDGFSRSTLCPVVRGAKYENYNGEHLEKQPDLTIKRINYEPGLISSIYNGLFIECKIIESGKPPLLYIKEGIRRYVDGEYAWASRSTFMIAYVRNQHKLPYSLKDSYKKNFENEIVKRCYPNNNKYRLWHDTKKPKSYITCHNREWSHNLYGSPESIKISHIWLKL